MDEGDSAPDFELCDHDGHTISLQSFAGHKNVVLCFYPKNHIFGCPSKKIFAMVENVIASYQDILDTDSVLFAISIDSVKNQKKFVEQYHIPYPHLSDSTKNVCKKYPGLNIVGLAKRATYIIDKNGIIQKIFRQTDTHTHGQDIATFLKQL